MDWGSPVGVMASESFIGAFRFLGGNFQSPVFKPLANICSPTAAEKFALQYLEGSVFLLGPQYAHPNWASYQIGKLQAR